MTVYKLDAPVHEPTKAVRGLVSVVYRLAGEIARIAAAIEARRSVKHLLAWDDRMLKDIGLTRGDVVAAVSGSVVDNAGRRLSRLANERRFADLAARRGRQLIGRGRAGIP